MIYQGVGFYLISTELYVKWFINYCIVKYFSLFLLEKLNIIRTSMNFATIKSLKQLNCYFGKYSLNAKESSKREKEGERGMRLTETKCKMIY